MTPEQAKEFIDSIKNSTDPIIHGFLQDIGAIKPPPDGLLRDIGNTLKDIGQGFDKFLNEFSGPFPIIIPPGFPGSPFNQHRTYYEPTVRGRVYSL